MSGPVLDFNPAAVTGREARPGDTRDAPAWSQQIADGFLIQQADTTANDREVIDDAYDPLIQPLLDRGYSVEQLVIGNRGGTFAYQGIWAAIQEERARDPEAFADLPATREEFEAAALSDYAERVAQAEERSERGSLVPQLIGGVAGAMTDPLNLYSLPLGGLGKTVGQRILTEGAVNAGIELFQQPGVQGQREALGRRDLTLSEAAQNVALAGVGGSALRGAIETPGVIRRLDPNFGDKELARAFRDMVPQNLRTPEQEASLSILTREAEIEDASPFVRTYDGADTHFARMRTAMAALEQGRIATPGEIAGAATAAHRPVARSSGQALIDPTAREEIKRAIAGPESGGRDNVDNAMGSSAAGRYQFIEATFTRLYRQEFRVSADEAQRAWDANRYDRAVQERLMDRLLEENAGALERGGQAADPGNLYLAHFAGSRRAVELLQADPSRPVSDFFSATAIRQNPTYLGDIDGRPRTVGEAIETVRSKVGDPAERSPSPIADVPELDPDLVAVRSSEPLTDVGRFDDVQGEIRPLMEPLEEIAAGSDRSLNDIDAIASELGSNPAAVRGALAELVERSVLTRNSETGGFMRKPRPNEEPKPYQVGSATFADIYGAARALSKEEAQSSLRVVDGRYGRIVEQSTDDGQIYLEFISDRGRSDIDLRLNDDGVATIDVDGFEGGVASAQAALSDTANRFGPAVIRDAMRQVRALYPEIKRFEGERVTGAGKGRIQVVNARRADQAAALRPRSDHSDLPPEADPRFEAPDGEGIRATSESVWHDIAADELDLDGQRKFDFGDGKGERSAADIRSEIEAEKSGLEAMKECLK